MRPNNYYPDINRFNLSGPPDYFLKQLWAFDDSLAIVPSRQGWFYRLGQRRKLNLAEKMTQDSLWHESDTKMLASYGLVPVTTILATANWGNPYLFEELRRRAPWRQGGADAYIKQIEDREFKEHIDKAVATDDMLTDISKDAWKLYNKKIGTRTSMWSPRTAKTAPKPSVAPSIVIA